MNITADEKTDTAAMATTVIEDGDGDVEKTENTGWFWGRFLPSNIYADGAMAKKQNKQTEKLERQEQQTQQEREEKEREEKERQEKEREEKEREERERQERERQENEFYKGRKIVYIDGQGYDITDFRHPGGSVIDYLIDQDATDHFNEFHFRSKKARAVLSSLPKVEKKRPMTAVDRENEAMMNDYRAMRQTFIDQGKFDTDYMHVYFRLLEIVFYFGLGVVLIPHCAWLSVLAFVVCNTRCGWVQHEAGHNSLTGNIRTDKTIQSVVMGFGLHMSSGLWNSMHNKHHATPQKIKHDIDLDTTPFVAFYNTAIEKNSERRQMEGGVRAPHARPPGKWVRLWMKFQAYTFLPVVDGVLVMLFWIYYLHPRKALRDKNWLECTALLLSHTLRPWLFYYFGDGAYSFLEAYGLFLLVIWGTGVYDLGHFSLSHTFTPVVAENAHPTWLHYSVNHTVDIDPHNTLVSWIMGYLNCQVEHHLFPSMPQYKQPEISPVIAAFCKKWGLTYQCMSYFDAWRAMFANLHNVGEHYFNMDDGGKQTQAQTQAQQADAAVHVANSDDLPAVLEAAGLHASNSSGLLSVSDGDDTVMVIKQEKQD